MKFDKKIVLIFALMLILAGGALGGFNYISNNIVANYSAGDKIKGFFNMSFNDENSKSLLTSNFNGNISLINFLNANNLERGDDYTCTTANCEDDYSTLSQTNGFSVQANSNGKFAGFKINGQNAQITSVRFNVSSNVASSCSNQLFIDVLNDNEDIILNTRHNNESCGVQYAGCYNSANNVQATIMNDREFCETINLPSAPAFYIGARILNSTGAYSILEMNLYDAETEGILGSCNLPRHSQNFQELKCIVNYPSLTNKTYYVCIQSQSNAGYKIGWETENPRCGTVVGGSGAGFSSFDNDFDIFAESIKFAGNPVFGVNDVSYDNLFNILLTNLFDNYLSDTYGRNCQDFDCVFPIRLFGQDQFFQLSDLNVRYETGGIIQNTNQFYELEVDESLVSSGELKLDIEKANFLIPALSTANKFMFYINGGLVFEKNINVRRSFLFDINTKIVPFGQNTLFKIITNETIINSTWNFGDGTPVQNVQGREISHAYVSTNGSIFDMTVSARNSQNISATKTFRIFVGNPRDLANLTIQDYKRRITNLTSRIDSYPEWIKNAIRDKLEFSNMQAALNAIEGDYSQSTTEEDFQDVMLDLIDLNVPKNINNLRAENSLPLAIMFPSINPSYIEIISNKDVPDNNRLKEAIASWMNSKFNSEISYNHVAAYYDFDNEVILSQFKIETKPYSSINKDTYLIFGQNIESAGGFKENYNGQKIGGSEINYLKLNTGNNQVFEFYIDGEIEVEDLGSYISPDVDELPVQPSISGECNINNICDEDEDENTCPEDCSGRIWSFTIWGWVILFFAAFAFYIILQEWYKRNYQSNLFPNDEELYNLINFVYISRKSGLNDEIILRKLEQSGWKPERIKFAIKKIDGNRTGMLEIPLFKFFENKKVSRELQLRQPRPVDFRFVMRKF